MKIFSIEGNIGSGKSTLIDLLKKQKGYCFLPEPVDVWNEIKDSSGVTILEKYYKDPKKYAFSFQMMAYITRLDIIKKHIVDNDTILITERSIYTDREIFAKMLHQNGDIEDVEYNIYLRWFDEFSTIHLDGIIYIKTTPEICLSRVEKRNRKGEESIPLSYLQMCHTFHEEWINTCSNILVIDGIPEHNEDTFHRIFDFIK